MVEKEETKKEEVKEEKKEVEKDSQDSIKKEKQQIKKEKASATGLSLHISTKASKYICKMIKGKEVDEAIKMLEKVKEKKLAVPMNGLEIPHRRGMMSGRYPVNASIEIIKLLKQLRANSLACGIEKPYITKAIPNKASQPYKRGGRRAKRTNIYLEAKNKEKIN